MIKINLLPRERIRRVAVAPRILVGLVAAVVLAGLTLVTIWMNVRNALVRSQIVEVNARIEVLKPQVAEVEALQRQINEARRKEQILRQLQEARIPWERVFNELRKILPADVWLNRIDAKGDGSLSFEGVGLSYESVARFMVNLNASSVFTSADFNVASKTTVEKREAVNFKVTARLVPLQKAAAVP